MSKFTLKYIIWGNHTRDNALSLFQATMCEYLSESVGCLNALSRCFDDETVATSKGDFLRAEVTALADEYVRDNRAIDLTQCQIVRMFNGN